MGFVTPLGWLRDTKQKKLIKISPLKKVLRVFLFLFQLQTRPWWGRLWDTPDVGRGEHIRLIPGAKQGDLLQGWN